MFQYNKLLTHYLNIIQSLEYDGYNKNLKLQTKTDVNKLQVSKVENTEVNKISQTSTVSDIFNLGSYLDTPKTSFAEGTKEPPFASKGEVDPAISNVSDFFNAGSYLDTPKTSFAEGTKEPPFASKEEADLVTGASNEVVMSKENPSILKPKDKDFLFHSSYNFIKFIQRTSDISYLFDKITGLNTNEYLDSKISNYIKLGLTTLANGAMSYASNSFIPIAVGGLALAPALILELEGNIYLDLGLKISSAALPIILGSNVYVSMAYGMIQAVSSMSSYFLTNDNFLSKIANSAAYIADTAIVAYTGNSFAIALEAVKIAADSVRIADNHIDDIIVDPYLPNLDFSS